MSNETHQKTSALDRFIKFSIVIAVLLVGFSIFYYLVIFLPKKNSQQLEQKIQLETLDIYKQSSTEQKIQKCLDDVGKRFSDLTKNIEEKKLQINEEAFKLILDLNKQQKEECYKKYSQ